jgi:putative membrane protein
MKLQSRLLCAAALATAALFVSNAQAAEETKSSPTASGKNNLSDGDKKFLRDAYKGGQEEVMNGKIAQSKAKNAATREVAAAMVKDHTRANAALQKILDEEKFSVADVKPQAARMDEANFDHSYLTALKADHEKDIKQFEREANDPGTKEDSDVKMFAKKELPTLKHHLEMVEKALEKVK